MGGFTVDKGVHNGCNYFEIIFKTFCIKGRGWMESFPCRAIQYMAEIEDVAKLAGVSPASVSRFLNNRSLLRDETAEKIQAAITKLNYSPNTVAVGLRTRHSKIFAFIIPTMNNLYYIELFKDIQRLCIEYEYTLCLYSVEEV